LSDDQCAWVYNPLDKEQTTTHDKLHRERLGIINIPSSLHSCPLINTSDAKLFVVKNSHVVSSRAQLIKANEIYSFANSLLGGVDSKSEIIPENYTMFSVIDSSRNYLVLGTVVVEPLETAWLNTDMSTNDVKCGIALVWVSEKERRRGIARILLDAVVER
jgi:ribosomal protein S18 acetylase RimI-like enzyme